MSRLPQPGSDEGTWGAILNDYLGVAHAADGTLKQNSLIVGAQQASQKGQANGYAPLDSASTVPFTNLPTALTTAGYYPLAAYGFFTATTPIETVNAESTLLNGNFFARVFIPAGRAINAVAGIVAQVGTVGVGGANCFAVYDDTGTLVASTPADNNLWANLGWAIGEFSSPIPAQATDRFVYVTGIVAGYSSPPYIAYDNVSQQSLLYGGYNMPNHRRAFYGNNTTVMSSISPVTYGSDSNYLPFYALG